MAEPTRIRATHKDGVADVRVRMAHAMESGQRKDPAGKPVPAWYISDVTDSLNGRPVMQAQLGPAVSRNPYLRLRIAGAKPGDRIAIDWVDTRGDRRHDEAAVS